MEYEFIFVVEGVTVDDTSALDVVFDVFDGLLTRHRNLHLLSVSGPGVDAVDAAHRLIASLRKHLPQLRVLRLDPDLVGVAEIADRAGRSRQNVQQWVQGTRQAERGAFPDPEGTVGRSLVWRWAEVNDWLAGIGADDGTKAPLRNEALLIDFMLPQWQHALDAGLPLLKILQAQDDRVADRTAVMELLDGALKVPAVMETIAALPRGEQHRLTIVCAVLLDPLASVLEQLGPDDVSALVAVQGTEGDLNLVGVSVQSLPGTKPITALGLTDEATVGDLVLLTTNGTVDHTTPLSLTWCH
ncbi:helix-turn-helix transcriptional regulator [Streptomyces sp. NPDC057654]|uniref:helix-turn-helix transcriptional regulator n=1 Tax=Streptomyces sp. NPDC057654 TaxID=3346196 RepID=UPI0036CDCB74